MDSAAECRGRSGLLASLPASFWQQNSHVPGSAGLPEPRRFSGCLSGKPASFTNVPLADQRPKANSALNPSIGFPPPASLITQAGARSSCRSARRARRAGPQAGRSIVVRGSACDAAICSGQDSAAWPRWRSTKPPIRQDGRLAPLQPCSRRSRKACSDRWSRIGRGLRPTAPPGPARRQRDSAGATRRPGLLARSSR